MGFFSDLWDDIKGVVDDVVDVIDDVVSGIWDATKDAVEDAWEFVWDEILNPVLEPIMGVFGIEDETIVQVQVVSQRVFNVDNPFVSAYDKAIINSATQDQDLYDEIRFAIIENTRSAITRYYNYGKLGENSPTVETLSDGYYYGLPNVVRAYADEEPDNVDQIIISRHTGATDVTQLFTFFGPPYVSTLTDKHQYAAWEHMQSTEASWDQVNKTWSETGYNNTCYIPDTFDVNHYWSVNLFGSDYYEASAEPLADLIIPVWEASSATYSAVSLNSITWPYLGNENEALLTVDYLDGSTPSQVSFVITKSSCEGTPPAGATAFCAYGPDDAYYCTGSSSESVTWTYVNTTVAYGGLSINFTDGASYERNIYIPYLPGSTYYIVEYEVIGGVDDGGRFVWIYDIKDDTYSELSQVVGGAIYDGWDFLPIAVLMEDGRYMDGPIPSQNVTTSIPEDVSAFQTAYIEAKANGFTNTTTLAGLIGSVSDQTVSELIADGEVKYKYEIIEYLTSKELLNKINIPIASLLEAIKSNNDDDQIEDAFFTFGVNLYSDNQSDIKYLRTFFVASEQSNVVDKAAYTSEVSKANVSDAPFNLITIKESNFSVGLQYNYVEEETLTGNIGPIGFIYKTINYSTTKVKNHTTSNVVFTYQINDTQYIRLTVFGLAMFHVVRTKIDTLKTKAIPIVDPASTTDEDKRAQANFNIPMSLTVLRYCGNLDNQEEIIFRAAHIVVYASDVQYLEWYETEDFARFVQIVLVVAAVLTFNPQAITLAGTTYTGIQAIAIQILITVAIQYALQLVLKSTDNEAIQTIARVAAALATAYVWGGSNFELFSAETALLLVDAVGQSYLAIESEELQSDLADFNKRSKEYKDELERIQDEIDNPGNFAQALTAMQVNRVLHYETPEEFYSRTLNTNPGIETLKAIDNFFENSLRLPELDPRLDTTDVLTRTI